MATLRQNSYIADAADVVSILCCKHVNHKTRYLLLACNELLTLPCSKLLDENWNDTADHLQNHVFGRAFDKEILKIIKVWMPNFPKRHVFHIVFSVEVPTDAETKAKDHFKWLSLADMKVAATNAKLCSPEILGFAMMKEELEEETENEQKICATKNLLSEVTEKESLILYNDSTPEKYLELLKSAQIEMSDQRCLYADFVQNCFPYLYMNFYVFKRILNDIMKWDVDDTFPLFRFFANNPDGLMSFNNFTNLIKHIRVARKLSTDSGVVTDDVQKYATSVGISSTVSITLMQFITAVGELKLRGTSTLLRFPKSVKEYLFYIGMNQVKPLTYQVSDSSKNIVDYVHSEEDSKSLYSIASDSFNISTHTITIKHCGAFIDIDEIWSQHDWVSPSSSKLLKASKNRLSVERFNQASAPNEVINCLKYFSQPSPLEGKSKMSWGQFDMRKLGVALIVLSKHLIEIMELESRLLELTSPIYVMGDIHGNFNNLMHFEEILWPLSPTLSPCNLLFLGDYVDRGLNGLEVVAYLFAYKVHNPKKVFLLRGNHEIRDIQKTHSFYKECIEKFGPQLGYDVWTSVNNVFDVMPLAARIDQRIFCCHGGIPPPEMCPNLSIINTIPTRLPLPLVQSPLSWNLMWNDPIRVTDITEQLKSELESHNGFVQNNRRGTGLCFSMEALNSFLEKNELSHFIRAHEFQTAGASIQFNGKLLTVFSTSDYCGGGNDSACILLAQRKISVIRMPSRTN